LTTSLIIPSYNPSLKLRKTLDSLVTQEVAVDELILVIDHTHYDNYVDGLKEDYHSKFNLKIVRNNDSGRGKSRNKGVEASSGNLLIFLDDDMLCEKDLIKKHIEYHLQSPGTIVCGNGYRNPKDANYPFGKFLINMEQSWKEGVKSPSEVTFDNFSFTACNLSLPKSIFLQLNGFDTLFTDGEDFDFAIRAIKQGIKVIYDVNLLAWHDNWPDIGDLIRRDKEYTKAKLAIFKVHPDYLVKFPHMVLKPSGKLKKIVVFLLKKPMNWFVKDRNAIFAHLPLRIKFIVYNLTISVNSVI